MKFDNNDTCVFNDSYVCIIFIDSNIAPKSLLLTNKKSLPLMKGVLVASHQCITYLTQHSSQGEIIESSLK
jgi:hypothetical protein